MKAYKTAPEPCYLSAATPKWRRGLDGHPTLRGADDERSETFTPPAELGCPQLDFAGEQPVNGRLAARSETDNLDWSRLAGTTILLHKFFGGSHRFRVFHIPRTNPLIPLLVDDLKFFINVPPIQDVMLFQIFHDRPFFHTVFGGWAKAMWVNGHLALALRTAFGHFCYVLAECLSALEANRFMSHIAIKKVVVKLRAFNLSRETRKCKLGLPVGGVRLVSGKTDVEAFNSTYPGVRFVTRKLATHHPTAPAASNLSNERRKWKHGLNGPPNATGG